MKKNTKMILLGFDGTSWNVLAPLLKSGKLPNFKRLMDKGVYANLRTPHPNFTPIIWSTILSGVEAKRHGIKSFFNTQNDLLVPRVWDVMMNEGKSAGVVGHYFTYPVNQKMDFCIPSHFDRGVETLPENYQFVRELTHLFESKAFSANKLIRYGIDAMKNGLSVDSFLYGLQSVLATIFHRNYNNWYHRFQRVFMDLSFDTFMHAHSRFQTDFASFYSPLPDTISHKYWCFYEPEFFKEVSAGDVERYGEIINDTYIHIDKLLGKLLKVIAPETQICIVSDHGFQKMESSKNRLVLVPEKLISALSLEGQITVTNLGHQILLQPKNSKNSVELLNETVKVLQGSRVPESDYPVFEDIITGENSESLHFRLYYKIVDMGSKILIKDREMKMSDIAKIGSSWSGRHHMEQGIFLLSGQGVCSTGEREIVEAADIMPTLLRLQGCIVADDLNGKVMDDMIDPEWAEKNPYKRVCSYEGVFFKTDQNSEDLNNEDEVTKKLKSLGYM